MHMLARSRLALLLALCPAACVEWPEFPEGECEDGPCDTETTTEDSVSASITLTHTGDPSSDGSAGTEGGTGSSTSGSESGSDSETSSTDEGPPPAIDDVTLTPATITKNGTIAVEVRATASDAVRLRLEDGSVRELSQSDPGTFVGEFAVMTGLDNGSRAAKLVPSRDGIDGLQIKSPYTVALPEPGTELFWEAADSLSIGRGWVAALATLPSGDIVELGTHLVNDDEQRCYLRRRTQGGAWGSPDIIKLLPGDGCEAVDLVIREDGTIHALLAWRIAVNSWGWWLGELPSWGDKPLTIASGPAGEGAKALAYRDGQLAVCGVTPTEFGDLDAFVDVIDGGQERYQLDHFPDDTEPQLEHTFDETPAACAFLGEDLVALVGDVKGDHDGDKKIYSRRFFVPVDLSADEPTDLVIAATDGLTQTFATALDIRDGGDILIAGYGCDEPCTESQGLAWTLSHEGDELSVAPLGLFSDPLLAPHTLRWSPAGYIIVGNGGHLGDDATFTLRAYAPGDFKQPLWTYSRKDPFLTHIPTALALGRFGEVYSGGLGASKYPALACVGG